MAGVKKIMSSQIKALVQKYYDMWNDGDFEKADTFMHTDIKFRGSLGFDIDGVDAFKEYAKMIIQAFPDLYHVPEEVVCEDDKAATYVLYAGTHKGKLFNLEATGERFRYNGAAFFTLDEGKFSKIRVLGDRHTLYEQLGLHGRIDSIVIP